SYRAEQERRQAETAGAVLDGLSDALMASFMASREPVPDSGAAPAVELAPASEPTAEAPMLLAAPSREPAAQDGPALVESLISESILASYRPSHLRLAA
ncbi:hypothetical protein, partial [Methylobacterium gnaphalii]